MNIAILGAGNSGCALAADYAARGHEVTLIKTSHSLHDDNFSHLCATGGRMCIHEFDTDTDCVIAHLSRDVADVRGKDIVLLCTQTGYHHDVLRRVVPFLTAGQILLMIPGYLSTAYALGLHPADGVIFAEAESNFIDGRICAPGEFQVGFRNVRNPIARPAGYAVCLSQERGRGRAAQPEHDRAHGRRDHDHSAHRGHERRILHVPRGVHAVGLESARGARR